MQFCAPDNGRKDRPKHVERFTRTNNLRYEMHLVFGTIRTKIWESSVEGQA